MRALQSSVFVLGVFVNASGAAAEISLEEIWAIVQQQQVQIAALTDTLEAAQAKLERTESQAKITEEQLGLTVDYLAEVETAASVNRTSVGGYGELHYNNLDANDDSRDFKEVDFHRFVLFFAVSGRKTVAREILV